MVNAVCGSAISRNLAATKHATDFPSALGVKLVAAAVDVVHVKSVRAEAAVMVICILS